MCYNVRPAVTQSTTPPADSTTNTIGFCGKHCIKMLCEGCTDIVWTLPGQLSASLAVMLLLQEEHRVVEDTVREVNRWPLLDRASLSLASFSLSFSRSFSLFWKNKQSDCDHSSDDLSHRPIRTQISVWCSDITATVWTVIQSCCVCTVCTGTYEAAFTNTHTCVFVHTCQSHVHVLLCSCLLLLFKWIHLTNSELESDRSGETDQLISHVINRSGICLTGSGSVQGLVPDSHPFFLQWFKFIWC